MRLSTLPRLRNTMSRKSRKAEMNIGNRWISGTFKIVKQKTNDGKTDPLFIQWEFSYSDKDELGTHIRKGFTSVHDIMVNAKHHGVVFNE